MGKYNTPFRIPALLTLLVMNGFSGCNSYDQTDNTLETEDQPQPGLLTTFRDEKHRIRLVTPTPNFYLESEESLYPTLDSDFQALWVGLLSILETGSYQFYGADELKIGDKPVNAGEVFLTSGLHRFELQYRRQPGPAQLRLQWRSNHFPLEPIPSRFFSHIPETDFSSIHGLAEQGRDLVEDLGCINCHRVESNLLAGRKGPNLNEVGSRLKAAWIYHWLLDPVSVHPGATMPALLDPRSARDITTYLQSLGNLPVKKYSPVNSDVNRGRELYESLGCMACHGSENLSLEGIGSKWSHTSLAEYLKNPGKHNPESRMPSMHLSDQEASQLADHLSLSRNRSVETTLKEGNETRGKRLVRSSGCLACHQLDNGKKTNSKPTGAVRLDELYLDGGCLSSEPRSPYPRYSLQEEQRSAIRTYLVRRRSFPEISETPIHDLHRSLRRLRCIACHQMNSSSKGMIGVPILTTAGEKLRTRFLRKVLYGNIRLRSWLPIRMPAYYPDQVEPLINAFVKASGLNPRAASTEPVTSQNNLLHGLKLLGNEVESEGLGCIGCHDWGNHQAQGERGPQLVGAAQRLRYEWYRRLMLDSIRTLPGTAMPTHFSDIDPDQVEVSLRDVWAGLGTDVDGPVPRGLEPRTDPWPAEARPRPSKTVLVIRGFLPEATPAAIAVGTAEGISYCFDAGSSRLLYAWQGGFLDLEEILHKKVGADRVSLTAQIVGKRFFRSKTFPFRTVSSQEQPQVQFVGYRYREGLPEFQYKVGEVRIRESIYPEKDGSGFRWCFQIQGVRNPLQFETDVEGPVTIRSSLGTVQQKSIRIPISQDVRFEIGIGIREYP